MLLGIDWGEKKVGLAIAVTTIAEPYKVIKHEDSNVIINEIKRVCEKEKVTKIVVGISENESGKKASEFGEKLRKELGIEVVFQDETLSSIDAQSMSIETGIKRGRRKLLEDAFAATVMLQSYIDLNIH